MNYHVFWAPNAERQLEAILKNKLIQDQLAYAALEIDRNLLSDPLDFGESRYDDVRVGVSRPLGVEYEVFLNERTVIVHGVWVAKKF
jgi:hypothetical protein